MEEGEESACFTNTEYCKFSSIVLYKDKLSESKGKLRQLINEHCVVTLDASVRSQQMLPVTTTDHKVAQCDERTRVLTVLQCNAESALFSCGQTNGIMGKYVCS